MKILLKKDVRNRGTKGSIIEVSDGYGANYLIPKGLGVLLTAETFNAHQRELAKEAALQVAETAKAQQLAQQLTSRTFKFSAPVGSRGAMIGTVSVKELKKALRDELQINVDKSDFPEHNLVNAFGLSHVKVQLYKGVYGVMNVLVEPKRVSKK